MFELGRQLVVLGDNRPVIGEQFYRCFAGIDHGFDGECHAGLEHNTGAGPSVVQDLGFVMKDCANAVAAILSNHRKAIALCMDLNHVAYITQMRAGFDLSDTFIQALLGDLDESFCQNTALTNDKCFAGIAMIGVFQQRHINVDDIAVFKDFFI